MGRDQHPEVTVGGALRRFQLADAVVDEQQRTVSLRGRITPLTDLSWRFLMALIEAAPHAVTYEQLAVQVWNTPQVTDETLAQRVRQVRQAFADSSRNPGYIRTLRGVGYQLIPAVTIIAAVTPDRAVEPAMPVATSSSWPQSLALAVGVAIVVALGWRFFSPASTPTTDPGANPRVQSGQVLKSGPTPALAELLKRAAEYQRRGEAAANDISVDLYREVLVDHPLQLEALLGLSYGLSHRTAKFEQAQRWAQEAAVLADRALAVEVSSRTLAARGFAEDAQGRVSRALEYYQRALALEPDNQGLRSSISYLLQVQGHLHQALQKQVLALAQSPATQFAELQLGATFATLDLAPEAQLWLARAKRMRPDNVFLTEHLAREHLLSERPELALAELDKALTPRFGHDVLRAFAYLQRNDVKRAEQAFTSARASANNKGSDCYECVAYLLTIAKLTRPAKPQHTSAAVEGSALVGIAQKLLASANPAIRNGDEWPEHRVQLAYLALGVGQRDQALEHLRQAVALGYRDHRWLASVPLLAALREEPAFVALLVEIQQALAIERAAILADSTLLPLRASAGE